MSQIYFADDLSRVIGRRRVDVECNTLMSVLDCLFIDCPRLERYLFNDQGCLRGGVRIYVDGYQIKGDVDLSWAVGASSKIYVF